MYFIAKKKNLSKFCSPIFKNAQSKKNIDIRETNNTFIMAIHEVAKIAKLPAVNIKYITCLKLKYPPNIFSSRLMSNGTLYTLIYRPPLSFQVSYLNYL